MSSQLNIRETAPLREGGSFLARAPPIAPHMPPLTEGIISVTMFSLNTLRRLGANDFVLESKEKIALKWRDCMVVYFYIENMESQHLNWIVALVSQQVVGPVFATCNLYTETEVANAFAELRMHGSHPLHWAAVKGAPFILAYRMGFPTAFYNGDLSVQALADWSISLACKADYYEHLNLSVGVQVEAPYQTGKPNQRYTTEAAPTLINARGPSSMDFRTERSIRGYNPRLPLALQDSELAKKEKKIVEDVEAGRRTGPATPSATPTTAGTRETRTTPERKKEPAEEEAPAVEPEAVEEVAPEEVPVEEVPVEEEPAGEVPVEEEPAGEVPVEEEPAGEVPVEEEAPEEVPVEEEPVEEEAPAESTEETSPRSSSGGSSTSGEGGGEAQTQMNISSTPSPISLENERQFNPEEVNRTLESLRKS